MTPYYDDGQITIYHADCRDVLPTLEPVDLVLTDPPYGVHLAEWDGEVPYNLLTDFLNLTNGPVLWFGGPNVASDVTGFPVPPQRVLVWAPTFKLQQVMAHGMAYRWHAIYAWQLPKKHDGPTWDVLNTPCDGRNFWNHPATKPLPLMRTLCGFAPQDGLILDPFMGSGTTLRAAKDLGRRAIGIELEERYCEIAVRRLSQAVLPLEIA